MKPSRKTSRWTGFWHGFWAVLSTAALSVTAVTPDLHTWNLALLFILLAASALAGAKPAVHIALFTSLTFTALQHLAIARYWPWTLLIPLTVYGIIVLSLPPLRRDVRWFRFGTPGKAGWLWILATVVVSAAALVGWYTWLQPDLRVFFAQMPAMPRYLIPLAGLGFALLNAVMEEIAFRGILMSSLNSAFNRQGVSLGIQALVFGLFHYPNGFPNGALGVLMTFVYGVMLGWMKIRSKGLLAPVITHAFADLTIFTILVMILR